MCLEGMGLNVCQKTPRAEALLPTYITIRMMPGVMKLRRWGNANEGSTGTQAPS